MTPAKEPSAARTRGAPARPVTLIASDDDFLASEALGRLRSALGDQGYALEEIAASEITSLMYALDTPSLFDAGRLVLVRDADDLKVAAIEQIAAWASTAPDGVRLALVASSAAKIKKGLGAFVEVIEAASPPPWEMGRWVVARAKSLGRPIATEAAQALVDAVGTDLRELDSALDLLGAAVSEGTIETSDVARHFRGVETQVWTFVDSVMDRDRAAALRQLNALLAAGENAIGLVAALARQLRTLAIVREAGGRSSGVIAKELGVKEGSVKRAFRQARGFDADAVRRGFRHLADADLALKGGEQGEGQPPEIVLEMLVAEICGARR